MEVNPQILNAIDFSPLAQPLDRLATALVGQSARAAEATIAAAALTASATRAAAADSAAASNTPQDQQLKQLQTIAAAVAILSGVYILFFKKR